MRGLAKILAATVLIVCAALTFRQTFIYRDLPTLLSDIIEKNPRNWMPYANLAEHLDAQGRYEEAVQLLTTCIARCEEAGLRGYGLFEVHRKFGFVLMEASRYDEAEAQFGTALALRPFDCRALYGQGMALASQAAGLRRSRDSRRRSALTPTMPKGTTAWGSRWPIRDGRTRPFGTFKNRSS